MRLTKSEQRKIATDRIAELFTLAHNAYDQNQAQANRYIKIALDIRNKFKIKLSPAQKKVFCKNCKRFLSPGTNCIVRTKNKTILYHCKECGYIRKQSMR